MSNLWRFVILFDARDGNLAALEVGLRRATAHIVELAGDAHVRIGVADMHPDLIPLREQIVVRKVDAAIEMSIEASHWRQLVPIAGSLADPIDTLAEPQSVEVMAGPMFSIVPVRAGNAFLSLAFRRHDATTSAQFQQWWLTQHAKIVTPVLGDSLLAYDQIHLDGGATAELSQAYGATPIFYDAYDNLTWADRYQFLQSISDHRAMESVLADEAGRINDASRRNSLMRRIY